MKDYKGTETADSSCPASTCQLSSLIYDGHERLQSEKVPIATAPTSYTYNPDDTLRIKTDPRGAKCTSVSSVSLWLTIVREINHRDTRRRGYSRDEVQFKFTAFRIEKY